MKKYRNTEVVIIGAGPAGIAASYYLSKHFIDHIILEKNSFGRDKICGDALSGKVTSLLKNIKPEFAQEMRENKDSYLPSWGVTFSGPNGLEVPIPFKIERTEDGESPGYIAKRKVFDQDLLSHLNFAFCTAYENQEVQEVEIRNSGCLVETVDHIYRCNLILSAEGTRALIAKKFTGFKVENSHYCAGLRSYYKNVKGLSAEGYIELHFVQEALPGYFWIFPLPNGEANVGIGMLSKYVSAGKVNLKKLMQEVIESDKFKHRFENAECIDSAKGWGLPLGSKKRQLAGNRFMLLGDAGSLIDPFTGEGIGNAMISGRIAADVCKEAIDKGQFDKTVTQLYTTRVYNKLWSELRLSRILQKLIMYPWLFNWIMKKISTNKELKSTITMMFEDVNLRKKFANPMFYIKLIFNK